MMSDDGDESGESKKEDKKRQGGVADYLSAPRRKRKSFIVMAFGKGVPSDLGGAVNSFVRSTFKNLAFSLPTTMEDLARQAARNISLMIVDDEFAPREELLALLRRIKEKKSGSNIPILFLTREVEELVKVYNKVLLPFHEVDEYVAFVGATQGQVFARIKAGVENHNRRRSRRYRVEIPVVFQVLGEEKLHPGRLLDLSVHGGLLKSDEGRVFKIRDQIKIHLPVSDLLPPTFGEFLRLSAKVRRLQISGERVGVSFEFMSESQVTVLTKFVTELVQLQLTRKPASAMTVITGKHLPR
jgi:hypothetical protein